MDLVFQPGKVFEVLYKEALHQLIETRVIAFEGSTDVLLRTGFFNIVKKHLIQLLQKSLEDSKTSAEIHRSSLLCFKDRWKRIQSSSTCLVCLRRRPQYSLPCGHCICENCVIVFGYCCQDDPWILTINSCILCGTDLPEALTVKVHPPTAGVSVLCIDGGGTRGVVPLELMKRIQDQIGLPIPFQKFFRVAFGISSGALSKKH